MEQSQEGKYETGETVKRGVVMAIQSIGNDLVKLTKKLDIYLPPIEASWMPEYHQARKAIEAYELTIQEKIQLLNEEAKE